ncbi:hypothetical protein WR25_01669 [Diploscapter pachys]|uniref:Uncharacterized protein n=1 Tax=Diploscapter pachys TaxID=2018661 RepID=A0A2A2JSD4_9BILA|nr:hypothetical protein WR25_01669 [Diploscapter pachys]
MTALIIILLLIVSYIYWRNTRSLSYIQTLDGLHKFDVIMPTKGFHDVLGNVCKWPIMSLNESDIAEYVNGTKNLNCQEKMPPLAYLSPDGTLTLSHSIFSNDSAVNEEIACYYSELSLSEDGLQYQFGQEYQISPNAPVIVPFPQFIVSCRNATFHTKYLKAFVNFASKYELNDRGVARGFEEATMDNPSLAILLISSVSYNQFMRHMPMTLRFLEENHFITSTMFNKVADTSFQNSLTILTGETVQPNDSLESLEGTYLWNAMKERGCMAMLNDDIQYDGPFYRRSRADKFRPNVEYFTRAYHLFNHHKHIEEHSMCMKDGKMSAEEYINIWKEFSVRFRSTCHFSFSYINGLTQKSTQNLAAIDLVLRNNLEQLKANGVFEKTSIVIMSDTGNRVSRIANTFTGKVEERNPFFTIRMPTKLISNYDIHAMLFDYASMTFGAEDLVEDPEEQALSYGNRGLSLFRYSLPTFRSCTDSGIPAYFCLCMDEKEARSLLFSDNSDTYNSIYSQIREELLTNQTCLSEVVKHDNWKWITIFTLNPMVLRGIRNEREWLEARTKPVESPVEFMEVGVMAFAPRVKSIPLDRARNMAILSRFRHYRQDDRIEPAGNKMIIWTNDGCIIKDAYRYCDMCYNQVLLS